MKHFLYFLALIFFGVLLVLGCNKRAEEVVKQNESATTSGTVVDSIFPSLTVQSVVFDNCDEVAVKFSSTNVVSGVQNDSVWYFEESSIWWAIVAAKPGGLVEYKANSLTDLEELVGDNDEKDGYYFFDGVHSVSDTTAALEAAFRHNAILNGVVKLNCTGYTPLGPLPADRHTRCIGATPSAALACCEAQAAADCRGDGFQFQGAVVTTNTQGGGYNADMNYDCIKPK